MPSIRSMRSMARRSPYANADTYEEGSDGYDRTHVDPIALNHVLDVVERIRRSKGFIGSQCAWYDRVCPSNKCVTASISNR